jgi:hypothetical protein
METPLALASRTTRLNLSVFLLYLSTPFWMRSRLQATSKHSQRLWRLVDVSRIEKEDTKDA